jgi:hypothetical protein
MLPTLTLDDLTAAVREELDTAGVPYDTDDLRNYLDTV